MEKLVHSASQFVWQADAHGSIEYFSESFYHYTGLLGPAALGTGWQSLIHPDDHLDVLIAWSTAASGEGIYELEYRLRGTDGSYRWFFVCGEPIRDKHGKITHWLGTYTQIDGRKRQERIRTFLADALTTLARTEDIVETCQLIAQHAVKTIAEFCFIDIRAKDGLLERVAWAHRDPARQIAMSTCTNCPPFCGYELESRFSSALSSKHALLIRDWQAKDNGAAGRAAAQTDPGLARWLHISSLISVPLIGREKTLGVVTFARSQKGDYFDETDVQSLEDVGHCVGVALESAELAARDHLVADRFQHAALPKQLPRIPGFTFDAVYQAAKSESAVGGDWYDAFRLGDGQVVLSIGDVTGSGLDAAVTMAAVRQSIRGAAQIYADPVSIINAADRALRAEQPNRLVTAFVAILDPLMLEMRYACAGHPPPMLRTLSGAIKSLPGNDLPLGLREPQPMDESVHTISLTEPALLLLYTDGLTEATRNIVEGEARLRRALESDQLFETEHPAELIRNAILGSGADAANISFYAQDDVAVLAVRIDDMSRRLTQIDSRSERRAHWLLDVQDAGAARIIRHEIAAALRERGVLDTHTCDTELLFSEMIGNVIRHASSEAEIALDLSGSYPVLHVLDRGPGFTFHARLPNDLLSESGRGLYIAASLTRELSVVPRSDGGSHARVVLACEIQPDSQLAYA